MKIAHVIGKMKKGGVESVVYTYVSAIIDSTNEFEFEILYDDDSSVAPPVSLVDKGVVFRQIPRYQHLFSYITALRKILKGGKYDIVHCHINALNVFPLFAAYCAGIPVRIAHAHSTSSKQERMRNFIKKVLRHTSAVFATDLAACSELAGRWNYGNRKFDSGKVTVFNNGIDIGRFTFSAANRAEIRTKYGIEDKFVIGHIGRFMSTKNHKFIISLFAETLKKRQDSVLLLVGDGDLLDEIKDLAAALGISDHVIFTGIVGDPSPLYSAMDVFILPSLYEGLPVVGIEAMTCGLTSLMSDAITRECALNDQAVYLPIDSAGRWANALEKMTAPDGKTRMASAGFFGNSVFNIAKSAGDMVSYYKRAVSTGNK